MNSDKCQYACKKCCTCKKDYSWNPNTCICENSNYLKSIVDDSVIVYDEIINVTESVSTNVTITTLTNFTSSVSINSDDKKVRYKMNCYILHAFLLVNILLVMIALTCYHYVKHRSK